MTNDTRFRNCKRCHVPFTVGARHDKYFCTDACAAAYVREQGKANIHADNHDFTTHFCQWCQFSFQVNGYGERGGQRAPKYCSAKCKQAAYRAGKKQQQQQAGKQQQQASQKQQQASQKQQQANRESYWQYVGTSRRSTEAVQAAYQILGCHAGASKSEVRNAYKKLMLQWHPDKNPGVDTTAKAQSINWAFDFVK